jgi:phosphoribosylaminoimidazolecarboxamide formyltransferase/IMP cyclohydrolase
MSGLSPVTRFPPSARSWRPTGLFVEVVLAPSCTDGALAVFAAKKNLRVLTCPVEEPQGLELRGIDGGFIAQEPDLMEDRPADWQCATERQPTDEERAALALAWTVSKHVKSNAIVVANDRQTVGIGAGQMSRVDSCRIAIDKAELPLAGSVAASDAFFPFADGLETLGDAGITAVIQPGGSKRDDEVIAAANERGIAMLLTGHRHFRH